MKKIKEIDASCAVCALCHASGVDEETVLRICTSCGFKPGEGMADDDWQEAANCLGLRLQEVKFKPMALYNFIKKYQDGLYLVATYDHLFVVDNSIIFDPCNPKPPGLRRQIIGAWRVTKK